MKAAFKEFSGKTKNKTPKKKPLSNQDDELYFHNQIIVHSIFASKLMISESFLLKHPTESWGNIRKLNLIQ